MEIRRRIRTRMLNFVVALVLLSPLLTGRAFAVTTYMTDGKINPNATSAWDYQIPKTNFGWDETPILYVIPSYGNDLPSFNPPSESLKEIWTSPSGHEYIVSYGSYIGTRADQTHYSGTEWWQAKEAGSWRVDTWFWYNTNDGRIEDTPFTAVSTFNVAAIPEPETYAMLLAGLGLLGFFARRRAQKAA
jgi:hypothetical protein